MAMGCEVKEQVMFHTALKTEARPVSHLCSAILHLLAFQWLCRDGGAFHGPP